MNGDGDCPSARAGLGARIGSGVIALAAMVATVLVGYWGYTRLAAAGASIDIGGHAPALIGLPTLAALAVAIVCGAQAFNPRSHIEFLGLRAEGVPAAVLSWTLVFSALVIALRALW